MLYGHVEKTEQGRPPDAAARPAGRDRRLQRLHPARLPPREQLHGARVPHHRTRRSAAHRHLPPGARQHGQHQGLLDHDLSEARPGGAGLRRRRLDGTVVEENIYQMAGAETEQQMVRRARAHRARGGLRARSSATRSTTAMRRPPPIRPELDRTPPWSDTLPSTTSPSTARSASARRRWSRSWCERFEGSRCSRTSSNPFLEDFYDDRPGAVPDRALLPAVALQAAAGPGAARALPTPGGGRLRLPEEPHLRLPQPERRRADAVPWSVSAAVR